MKILVAEHSGFCFGVKRAIDMAEDKDVYKRQPYCIRVLIQAYLDSPENLQHIYLNEACLLYTSRCV